VQSAFDRVFVSPALEAIFPLCSLLAETSLGSDHTPMLFDTDDGPPARTSRFFFESGWFSRLDFLPLVHAQWQRLLSRVGGWDIIDWWVFMSVGLR
jgi:hypothetical protein